ncbi:MAG: DUF3808 domain-containing protein [Ignavibacteria bacterium]|nr:DUF3808 domain-containing protein [Ignavibacteria bacterium]
MRFLVPVLMMMLFSPVRAGETDWEGVHNATVRGINYLYNLEMDRALMTFDSVTVMAPGDPRGRFFRSMVHFWTFSLRNQDEDFDQFMTYSDSVIVLCQALIDRNDEDAVSLFYLGGIRGYRGLAYQMRGSLLDAVMEGRSGYLSLEEAVHLRPDMSDAHMGFGLFRYLVAKIPSGLSWVTGLLGFEGDLEGGLRSLRYAADHGVYTRSEATLYLSQFLRREGMKEEAEERLEGLIRKHPDNTLFLVLKANWAYRDNRIDEALELLGRAEEINERTSIRHGEEFIYSTRGAIAYRKNNFALARKEFDRFLNGTTLQSRVPNITYYRIAVARDIGGDREGAVDACRLMRDDEESFRRQNGAFFYRKGMELAFAPLTAAQQLHIRGENARARGALDSAVIYYDKALQERSADDDVRALCFYGLQETAFDQEEYDKTVTLGNSIVSLHPLRERWVQPYAYLKSARALRLLGQLDEAEAALDAASEFDDFDFQDSFERSLDRELEDLERRRDQIQ